MCSGLTPAQVNSRLRELDRLQRQLEISGFILCGVFLATAAACYVGVIVSARAGNGPATTAWVAFAVLASGITAAFFKASRAARKRRMDRKEPPDVPEASTGNSGCSASR